MRYHDLTIDLRSLEAGGFKPGWAGEEIRRPLLGAEEILVRLELP